MPPLPPPLANRQLLSVSQINNLPHAQMTQVYRQLLPPEILQRFHIDPETLADEQGRPLFECRPGVLVPWARTDNGEGSSPGVAPEHKMGSTP